MSKSFEELGRWDHFVGRAVERADRVVRYVGELPGRVIRSRRHCSAGVFFWPSYRPRWAIWLDPDGLVIRMGRVELQIDRPVRCTA